MSYRISDAQYARLENFYCAYCAMEMVFQDDEACPELKRINERLNLLLAEVFQQPSDD